MAGSVYEGFEKMRNGDLIGGMVAMAPTAIKGPTQAWRMSSEGYVDTLGNKLPLTPTGTAILQQLLGFTPHAKAEYSEARTDQSGRRAVLVERAKVLRTQIVKALEPGGDRAGLGELLAKARKFDRDNPAFAVGPDIAASLERRARLQAVAKATQTPIGVRPNDTDGRAMTGYADVEFRP
jgi:hypothetical protein